MFSSRKSKNRFAGLRPAPRQGSRPGPAKPLSAGSPPTPDIRLSVVATELFRYSTLLGPAGTLSIPAGAYDDPAAARALNFWGFKTASQGAQTSIYAATSPELTSRRAGGRFLRDCADADDEAVLASSLLGLGYTDEALSRALWRRAEQLSGAAFRVPFRPEPLLLKSEKSATGSFILSTYAS